MGIGIEMGKISFKERMELKANLSIKRK